MSKTVDPKNMTKFDRQYLKDRGIDPDEYAARFALTDDDEAEEVEPAEGQEPGRLNQDPDAAAPDYADWDVADLKREITQRNETRDEDGKIVPEGTGTDGRLRKSDLVAALEADDALDADDSDDEDEA